MKNFKILICLCISTTLFVSLIVAQPSSNANDAVPPLNDHFRYGVNLGYYPNWGTQDTILANIAAGNPAQNIIGAAATTLRPTLPEWFVNQFGYQVRGFAFDHYETLGMTNHTVFLEGPETDHTETTQYCPGESSHLFKNMYLPIWDDGTDGTPVNDENYFALYVYNTALTYQDHVKFWEIWNEPDYSFSSHAYDPPGTPGNWWENDPDPCDMSIKAPIYHYIRLLRIAYEVIKTVDPTAYITTGGIGYPSFLDAILRNTDNPADGAVNADYPLTGGAYFDVVSYHNYPHIENCYRGEWNNATQQFDYKRHSDAGADCLRTAQAAYQTVLDNYNYDGNTFPHKLWIVTESNVPRKGILPGENNYGNDVIQRNWMIKALVTAQLIDLKQLHVYKLGEEENYDNASYEFQLMGLFENLNNSTPYNHIFTDSGIAYKTTSEELRNMSVDFAKTADLLLPDGVKGAAFVDDAGNYKYVLWAETTTDQSEVASAIYSFPASFNLSSVETKNWDYSMTGSTNIVSSQDIALTGSPIFIVPDALLAIDKLAITASQKNYNNIITWQAKTDSKAAFYVVEKSADGLNGWESFEKVEAANPEYRIADLSPFAETYYRVRVLQTDGKYEFSNIAVVKRKFEQLQIGRVFPVPANEAVMLVVNSPKKSDLHILLSGINGKTLLQKTVNIAAGENFVPLDLSALASGFYFVQLNDGRHLVTHRVIKNGS